MLGSARPTHRMIWKLVGIRDCDVVAPTTIQDSSLVESGALRKLLNRLSLEGPDGESVATVLIVLFRIL